MKKLAIGMVVASLLAAAATAQDSVSKKYYEGGAGNGLPGDGLSPWDSTQQCADYVVDLVPFTGSWGTPLALGALVKTSKSDPGFFGSLASAQAISRLQAIDVAPPTGVYYQWNAPGFGVNATENYIPATVDLVGPTNQFALALSEYAFPVEDFGGIVGAIVNYEKKDPNTLYVHRVNAAVNGCDEMANLAQFGFGAIDEQGNVVFRADDFGTSSGCGLPNLTGNNIFHVDMAARDCGVVNVVSNNGLADSAAGNWVVANSGTIHNVPNMGPESVFGTAYYLGSNFNTQFRSGPVTGAPTYTGTGHLNNPGNDHRGAVAYVAKNIDCIGGTRGTSAVLAKDSSGATTVISVFGLNNTGQPVNPQDCVLPATVIDNLTGVVNAPGANEFDHYHSQAAYRGGTSQIAMNVTPDGEMLLAGTVYMPVQTANGPNNYIAVCRVNPDTCAQEWTMAGYNRDSSLAPDTGKEIWAVDAAGNEFVIGRLARLDELTGGSPTGPSMSAPMIDAAGNVWFVAAAILTHWRDGSPRDVEDPDSVLVRAVYDPAQFSYKLELVLEPGNKFVGANSNVEFMIQYLCKLADSDSVESGTAWSQNIMEDAYLGKSLVGTSIWQPEDARSLGGMFIMATLIYNVDGDSDGDGEIGNPGDFDNPTSGGGSSSKDEAYTVTLYIQPDGLCGDTNCDGVVNSRDIDAFVLAITDKAGYAAAFPNCPITNADTNFNSVVDSRDIDSFVAAVTSGVCD